MNPSRYGPNHRYSSLPVMISPQDWQRADSCRSIPPPRIRFGKDMSCSMRCLCLREACAFIRLVSKEEEMALSRAQRTELRAYDGKYYGRVRI